MSTFYISNKGLTTLKGVRFLKNVTELICSGNRLTSLEHCPANITKLYCSWNQLTSLEHCPASVTILVCGHNQLTSLEHCPASVTELNCCNNHLTSLKHCPASVTYLDCSNNQLTSLENCPASVTYLNFSDNQLVSLKHCPACVTELYCHNNLLSDEYKDLSFFEIHKINRKKSFLKGLKIIQKLVQNSMSKRIQKKWRWWFYDDLDSEGISRFARGAVDELSDFISKN